MKRYMKSKSFRQMLKENQTEAPDEVVEALSYEPPTKWGWKYHILPFSKEHFMPMIEREYAQCDAKLEPYIRDFISHLTVLVEVLEPMLADMPDTEQEWIDLIGPDYKTAE
jgi:hypothetical protein